MRKSQYFRTCIGIVLFIYMMMSTGCEKHHTPVSCVDSSVTANNEPSAVEPSEKTASPVDYSSYLVKTWVPLEWNSATDPLLISLYITKVESRIVTGKIASELTTPYTPTEHCARAADFTGIFQNNMAVCFFENETFEGAFTLQFKEAQLKVVLTCTNRKSGERIENIQLALRPYKLWDAQNMSIPPKTYAYGVDLNTWGKVNISTTIYGERKLYPRAFLTNEQDDILYEFNDIWLSGTKIIDVTIEDVNEDGLQDIKMTTGFFDYDTGEIFLDMPFFERTFMQMNNGFFYQPENSMKELNPTASPT